MVSATSMTTTTLRNKNQFAIKSAYFACVLTSFILAFKGFGATTYYFAGTDATDWNTVDDWVDISGSPQGSFSDTNTYGIDPNQTLGGVATAGSRVDVSNTTFAANNLTIESGGRLVLDANASVDELTLNAGQIANYSGASIRTLGDGVDDKIILGAGTTTTVNANSSTEDRDIRIAISAVIEGSGNLLLRSGSGTLATSYIQLNESNTYNGTTTLQTRYNEGALIVNDSNALQNSTLNLDYIYGGGDPVVTFNQNSVLGGLEDNGIGSLDLDGRTISVGNNNQNTAFDSVISNGNLNKIGTGTLTLSNTNTYGNTTIGDNAAEVGVVNVTASGALGSGTVKIISGSNGRAQLTLNSTSGITLANAFETSGTGPSNDLIDNQSGSNEISGTITLIGGGGWTAIKSSGGSIALSGDISVDYTSGRTLRLGGSASGTVSGQMTDGGGGATENVLSVAKIDSGTWVLSGNNSYTGTTNITGGTLEIAGAGDINNTSGITIGSGATLRYNSSVGLNTGITNNGGTVGGTGSIGVAVTLDSIDDTLAPGNSPGIQTYGTDQTWGAFTYEWETNNFTGTTAGADFDQIAITGSLDLTGAAAGSYILDVLSLTALDATGDVPNFSEIDRSWDILTTTTGITGFDASYWTIQTGGFSSSPVWAGTWSLGQSGNDLVLTYTLGVIPEPSTIVLAGLGLMGLVFRRHRRSA